jgi:hypothetical protein
VPDQRDVRTHSRSATWQRLPPLVRALLFSGAVVIPAMLLSFAAEAWGWWTGQLVAFGIGVVGVLVGMAGVLQEFVRVMKDLVGRD